MLYPHYTFPFPVEQSTTHYFFFSFEMMLNKRKRCWHFLPPQKELSLFAAAVGLVFIFLAKA